MSTTSPTGTPSGGLLAGTGQEVRPSTREVALELVGRAVLARLALDLDDRALALRAARHAVPLLEQLLADLTDPAVGLPGGAVRPAVTLEDLLAGAEDDDVGAPS